MSHRKGLKAIPALTAFAISPLLPSSSWKTFLLLRRMGGCCRDTNSVRHPWNIFLRLCMAIFAKEIVIFDTSADWEISTAWRKGECAWKEQTFLQSRGSKIHTGCIYLPFNSFWHGCILAFQSIPDSLNAQAQCLCQANRTKVDQFLVLSQVKKGRKLAKPHPLHVRHQEFWEISLPCDYRAPI